MNIEQEINNDTINIYNIIEKNKIFLDDINIPDTQLKLNFNNYEIKLEEYKNKLLTEEEKKNITNNFIPVYSLIKKIYENFNFIDKKLFLEKINNNMIRINNLIKVNKKNKENIEYYLLLESEKDKSNYYLSLYFLYNLKKKYNIYIKILNRNNFNNKLQYILEKDENILIIICDDIIYSGIQMNYNLLFLKYIGNDPLKCKKINFFLNIYGSTDEGIKLLAKNYSNSDYKLFSEYFNYDFEIQKKYFCGNKIKTILKNILLNDTFNKSKLDNVKKKSKIKKLIIIVF